MDFLANLAQAEKMFHTLIPGRVRVTSKVFPSQWLVHNSYFTFSNFPFCSKVLTFQHFNVILPGETSISRPLLWGFRWMTAENALLHTLPSATWLKALFTQPSASSFDQISFSMLYVQGKVKRTGERKSWDGLVRNKCSENDTKWLGGWWLQNNLFRRRKQDKRTANCMEKVRCVGVWLLMVKLNGNRHVHHHRLRGSAALL